MSLLQYVFARYYQQALDSDGRDWGLLTKLNAAPATSLIAWFIAWTPIYLVMHVAGINQSIVDLCKRFNPHFGEMAPSVILSVVAAWGYVGLVLFPKAAQLRQKYLSYRKPATLSFVLPTLGTMLAFLVPVFLVDSNPLAATLLWLGLLLVVIAGFRFFLNYSRICSPQ